MPFYKVTLEDGREFKVETEAQPTEAEVLAALAPAAKGPTLEQLNQGYGSSMASSAGRGLLRIAADIPGGLGYLTGADALVEMGESIEGAIDEALPINPLHAGDFAIKAAGAVGQAVSMLVTG